MSKISPETPKEKISRGAARLPHERHPTARTQAAVFRTSRSTDLPREGLASILKANMAEPVSCMW